MNAPIRNTIRASIALCLPTVLAVTACGSPAETPDAGQLADSGPGPGGDSGTEDAGAAATDGGQDAGSDSDGGALAARVVRDFDPDAAEYPESVALHGGDAYVTFALDGRVVRVAADGTQSDFGTVPIPVAMSAFALGIAMGPDGSAYVALAKADPSGPAIPGVYRIPPAGGAGVLHASHPMMVVPNDLELDGEGNLYVTEGPTGIVFRVGSSGGVAEIWLDDPLLDPAATATGPCGPRTSPFPIGANGIVVEGSRVIVNNTETASIVAIPIETDGSAGAPSSLVTSCALLAGTDGLSRDADDGWLTTVQSTHAVVRIAEDGALTELVRGAPLTSPAAVDVGDFGAPRTAVVASSAFGDLFAGRPTMPSLAVLPR